MIVMKSIFSNLTETEKVWKQDVEAVLKTELEPNVDAIERGKKDIIDVVKALGKHGYCGITFPVKLGGLGLTMKHELIVADAISSYNLAVNMSRLSGFYPAMFVQFFGKARELKDYIEPLVKGEKIGAFCFTEPDAGSDLSQMKTIAEKDPATGDCSELVAVPTRL
jgi:alkylation response protein AidB-like acyl-CoA dehydrogenase